MLPKYLTTVTPFTRTLALFLFVVLLIIAFILGMQYQNAIIPEKVVLQKASEKIVESKNPIFKTRTPVMRQLDLLSDFPFSTSGYPASLKSIKDDDLIA